MTQFFTSRNEVKDCPMSPKVSIIILNWNGLEDTIESV